MWETPVQFLGQEYSLEKDEATHSSIFGFPWWLSGKESTCNAGDLGSIPGWGRCPEKGNSYPLQYSGLEKSVFGVTRSQTQQSDFDFTIEEEIN